MVDLFFGAFVWANNHPGIFGYHLRCCVRNLSIGEVIMTTLVSPARPPAKIAVAPPQLAEDTKTDIRRPNVIPSYLRPLYSLGCDRGEYYAARLESGAMMRQDDDCNREEEYWASICQ